MRTIEKVSGIFGIGSAVGMTVMWVIIFSLGLLQADIAAHATEYGLLLAAEFCTASLSLIGGLSLLRGKAHSVFKIAMGMLLYAVIMGAGKFLDRGMLGFGLFFITVAVATSIVIILNLRASRQKKA